VADEEGDRALIKKGRGKIVPCPCLPNSCSRQWSGGTPKESVNPELRVGGRDAHTAVSGGER